MPLQSANLNTSFSYDLLNTDPFGSIEQGPASESFTLQSLDLAVWQQAILALFTVFAKGTITGDTNTNTTISNVSSFTNLVVGQRITGTNIPAGTHITVLTPGSSTITISQAATGSTAGSTFTYFNAPYGAVAALAAGGSLSTSAYYYVITAVGTQGTSTTESYISNEVTATPSGANLSILLTWSAVQGATAYNIYRGTISGSEDVLVYTVPSVNNAAPVTTFTDDGTYTTTSQSPPGSQPNNYIEFSVASYTSKVNETFVPKHALSIEVLPVGDGATCVFGPGTTNGLTWIFGGSLTLTIGSTFAYSEPVPATGSVGTGVAITSTTKTFRFTNNGGNTLSATFCLLVALI